MAQLSEHLYSSPNGDRWHLIRDPVSGRMFVRHQPNVPSGGHVSDVDVDEFLSRSGSGPEYLALRQRLAELAQPGGIEPD
jgi:hypothetical protein